MKIEKMSDNQIKFILNKTDLADRDINFPELEYGSEKARDLFYEMMEQAKLEYGFSADNALLMIEAIPMALDSVVVVVTKISTLSDIDTRFNLFSDNSDYTPLDYINKYSQNKPQYQNNLAIYYFDSLDQIIESSKKIIHFFRGRSSVYKYKKHYYLILDGRNAPKASNIMSEYGRSYPADIKSKYHLMEHGEVITSEYAMEKYSSM